MQTAPEISEAVARTDKSVPRQGHRYYRDNTAENQVTLRRIAPRHADPPLVPERHPSEERMDLEGFEPSPVTSTGSCAAVTPQAHEPSLLLSEQNFGLQPAFIDAEFRFGTDSRGTCAT